MNDHEKSFNKSYKKTLRELQIGLVNFQRHLIKKEMQILIILRVVMLPEKMGLSNELPNI